MKMYKIENKYIRVYVLKFYFEIGSQQDKCWLHFFQLIVLKYHLLDLDNFLHTITLLLKGRQL